MSHTIKAFYDPRTFTLTYVVYDPTTRDAVIIDPVLDYDPKGSRTWTDSADEVIAFAEDNALRVHYILETHAHADHLSGSQHIKNMFPDAKIGIGAHITDVQTMFKGIFDLPEDFATDGSQFDALFDDGQRFGAGTIDLDVIYTPGHTPACVVYKIDDAIFTGDTLFMPDQGTGRCDFPGGSSETMYHSIHERLYGALDPATRVFVGHDYQPGGREVAWETTLAEEMAHNIQLKAATTKDEYVTFRDRRDAGLEAPRLLFQSVQVNADGGRMPAPHANGIQYLRIPVNVFKPTVNPDQLSEGKL